MMVTMEVIYRLNKWTSSNHEWLTTATAECLVCQNGDQHSAPSTALHCIVIRQPAVAAWLYWITSLTERATICSRSNRYYSGYGFAFPLLDCSSKSTRCGPMDDLVTVSAFPQCFFFFFFLWARGLSNKIWQWSYDCEILWSHPALYCHEKSDLVDV